MTWSKPLKVLAAADGAATVCRTNIPLTVTGKLTKTGESADGFALLALLGGYGKKQALCDMM